MANTKKYVSLDKLGLYDEKIKGVIATSDATTLQSAKDYVDDSLKLYEPAGTGATEAGKVQVELDKEVTRAKGVEAGLQTAIDAINNAETGILKQSKDYTDAALQAGAIATDNAINAALGYDAAEAVAAGNTVKVLIDAVDDKADKNAEDIVAINAAIDNIQKNAYDDTEIRGLISDNADAIAELAGAHAKDIEDLEGSVEEALALKADKTALDEVSGVANAAATKVALEEAVEALEAEDERIAGLVATEQARAEGVEAGLDERLEKVEAFFVGAAEDEGEGENLKNALDTLVEIQTYIDNDGAAADQMVKDIAANKKAIEDHAATDHNFAAADATLKSELEGKIALKAEATVVEGIDGRLGTAEGKITTVEGKVSTLEGEMDAVQGAVATKAEAQDLADAVESLEGADAELLGKIEALEGKFTGEGSVEDMIADAKQEAIDAAVAADAVVLEAAKTDAANKDAVVLAEAQRGIEAVQLALDTHIADANAVAGRVTTAEGEIDTLQTEMDAVEALAAANDAAIKALQTASATHALQSDLEAVSGRVTTLETWHNNFVECSEEDINALFQ